MRETNAQPAVLVCVRATTDYPRWEGSGRLPVSHKTCKHSVLPDLSQSDQAAADGARDAARTHLFYIDQNGRTRELNLPSHCWSQAQSQSRLFSGAACGRRTEVADGPLVFARSRSHRKTVRIEEARPQIYEGWQEARE